LNGCIERLTLTGANRLLTVSTSLARHMESAGFDAERIAIVPNGVPTTDAIECRSAPASTWTLGAVALFRPRKGMEVLLDALALLRSKGLPVQLRAVGPFETPQYEAELKARVARRKLVDQVRWTGFTRNVSAELANMDLFVLPSLFGEGLPMVVLEAMAAGVPVVGTKVEGIPEAIRDGVDGVLAEPGDVEDLASAIARVLKGDLDWAQLSTSARQRQAERFSDRGMAEGVAAVYRQALEAASAPN
jgi:glycosyltransferase involved in cell wall biosynthesis